MPQSLSHILLHVVFSTKDRFPHLTPAIRPTLHAYLAATARSINCECYRVGGVADHIHLAIKLPRTLTTSKLVETLKSSSSRWLKDQSPDLSTFAWQSGYGAFSISDSHLSALTQYIENQEAHHRTTSFQEEYLALLTKLKIPHDERYLWD
jgi:putative transposase